VRPVDGAVSGRRSSVTELPAAGAAASIATEQQRLPASVRERDQPFDLVSIDVEGLNVEVFHELPTLPEMLCIELDPHSEVERLVRVHYPNVTIIGGNIIGWREPK
jgi:hypothetical protein